MFTANREFDFPCTPDQTFTRVAREFFANKPRWDPDITELIKTSQGEVAAGTTGRETRRAGGRNYVTDFVITEFEPGRRFAHRSTSGAMAEDATYTFEPNDAGTHLTLALNITPRTLPMRIMSPLIRRTVQRNFAVNIERFRQHVGQVGVVPR